jgi:hypothetical protein
MLCTNAAMKYFCRRADATRKARRPPLRVRYTSQPPADSAATAAVVAANQMNAAPPVKPVRTAARTPVTIRPLTTDVATVNMTGIRSRSSSAMPSPIRVRVR